MNLNPLEESQISYVTIHPSSKPGLIICDGCGTEQRADRRLCFQCGKTFTADAMLAASVQPTVDMRTTQHLGGHNAGDSSTLAIQPHPQTVETSALLLQINQKIDEQINLLRQVAMLRGQVHQVVLNDVNMDFVSIVVFLIKWSLAAIPAMIILWIIMGIVFSIVGGLFLF